MEGAAEANETTGREAAKEAPHIKSIGNDQPAQQSDSCSTLGTPGPEVSQDTHWPEQLSMMRSPDMVLQTIGRSRINFNYNRSSQAGFQPPCTGPRSNNLANKVEELTLKNYSSNDLSFDGSSSSGEPMAMSHLWANFSKLTSRPREKAPKECLPLDHKDGKGRGFLHPFGSQKPLPCTKLELKTSKLSEEAAGVNNNMLLSDSHTGSPTKIQSKVSSGCGFQQFFIRSSLKGKGAAYKHQQNHDAQVTTIPAQTIDGHNTNTKLASSSLHTSSGKADRICLLGDRVSPSQVSSKAASICLLGNGGSRVVASHPEGVVLREWLKPKRQRINRVQRMHLFKQILNLTDSCHSQGLALQHLRPSYFLVLPINQVKYIGPFIPQGKMKISVSLDQDFHQAKHLSKRKLYYEQDEAAQGTLELKHQKLSDASSIAYPRKTRFRENYQGEENEIDNCKAGKSRSDVTGLTQVPYKICGISSGDQLSLSELDKLEERWYASPEELDDCACSLSSNIYSLGVLFFELFCCSETWDIHCAVMSNIHHRILPPHFLSESPKEAGFCLWLLHPEPYSRPISRDIILSELVKDDSDLSTIDHSSALIEEEDAEADLLLHFLLSLKDQKDKQAADLVSNLEWVRTDLEKVESRNSLKIEFFSNGKDLPADISNISAFHSQPVIHEEIVTRLFVKSLYKERFMKNFDQLENAYFSMKSRYETPGPTTRSDTDVLKMRDRSFQVHNDTIEESDDPEIFFEGLCNFARYSKFEVCGGVKNVDILNCANVICSLSFDRDKDYFAAAGVSKKIKIFEFSSLLDDTVDIHYPLIEMPTKSKLSCVCWNSYIKNYLASTDYEGVVQLWDASTGQGFTQFTEHKKRAWSVNFSQVDPTKLASGSDDFFVKLWSISEKNCINTIRNSANVCCVQFSPYSSHLLSFGSANYRILCFDLRNTRIPWCTLVGHGKAVSFVKFLDSETLVSASTDNTLKIWDLKRTNSNGISDNSCCLTLKGHTNEKNFVGLSVSDGYIACGSETNEVYAYHRRFPMPMTSHKFGSIDPITAEETNDDGGQFVSSVCWRGKSNMVVAANSTGSIKVLKLV
ncbi:hypothetical protein Cni_G08071 [Canna indica]|uniref:Uncharacterized protein n=1 Tax=Canna indica TaxID=4628 RepID=A0AAQ3K1H9_9LILI|nr:hypothetical protein Cni_G08071 [Canna indica]